MSKPKKNIKKVITPVNSKKDVFLKFKFINNKYFPYLLSLAYTIFILIIALKYHKIGSQGIETDFYWSYAPQAKALLKGILEIDQYRGPLYQIILSFFGLILSNDFFTAGILISAVSSGAVILLTVKIIDTIINRETAAFVAILVCSNSFFIEQSYSASTDMLFFVFFLSAIYFVFNKKELKTIDLFLSGLFTSLAYLTRYSGISLIISILISLFFIYRNNLKNKNSFTFLKFGKYISVFVIPIVLCVTIWGFICLKEKGSFFYNDNFRNTAFTVYKPEKMANQEWTAKYEKTFNSMYEVVSRDFGKFVNKIFIDNFSSHFISDISKMIPLVSGILISAGLIFFLLRFISQTLNYKLFFLIGLFYYIQTILIFYSQRFSFILLPLYFLFLAMFFRNDAFSKLNFSIWKFKFFGLLLIALIVNSAISAYNYNKENISSGPTEVLQIRDWAETLENNFLENKTLISQHPHAPYYLNMKYMDWPFVTNYEDLIKFVKSSDADFIFIENSDVLEYTSMPYDNPIWKILNIENPPEFLELVKYTENPISILYKIKK